MELLVIHKLFDIEGCDEELSVVDALVTEIVNLINDSINLFVLDVDITLLNGELKFISIDKTGAILINLGELLP